MDRQAETKANTGLQSDKLKCPLLERMRGSENRINKRLYVKLRNATRWHLHERCEITCGGRLSGVGVIETRFVFDLVASCRWCCCCSSRRRSCRCPRSSPRIGPDIGGGGASTLRANSSAIRNWSLTRGAIRVEIALSWYGMMVRS